MSLTTVGGNAFPYDFRGLCDVDTVINPVEGTQASSSAAEQTQPQVQSAQELIPMHLLANDTGRNLAIPSAGPTTVGAIHVMSGDEWTGRLFSNGTFVYAQAQAKEAARDPYANAFVTLLLDDLVHSRRMLSEWPEDLQLEHVPVPNISSLDIQTWMLKTKAAVVRIRCLDQMDNWVFDQFVEELRNHRGESPSRRLPTLAVSRLQLTVRSCEVGKQGQTLDRLLLMPVGTVLHCAVFLDGNIPERPGHQESRRIRVLKPRELEGSRKKKGSRRGPRPDLVATPTPPEGVRGTIISRGSAESNPIANSEEMEDSNTDSDGNGD